MTIEELVNGTIAQAMSCFPNDQRGRAAKPVDVLLMMGVQLNFATAFMKKMDAKAVPAEAAVPPKPREIPKENSEK